MKHKIFSKIFNIIKFSFDICSVKEKPKQKLQYYIFIIILYLYRDDFEFIK